MSATITEIGIVIGDIKLVSNITDYGTCTMCKVDLEDTICIEIILEEYIRARICQKCSYDLGEHFTHLGEP